MKKQYFYDHANGAIFVVMGCRVIRVYGSHKQRRQHPIHFSTLSAGLIIAGEYGRKVTREEAILIAGTRIKLSWETLAARAV